MTKKIAELKKLIGNTPLIQITYIYKGQQRVMNAKAEWFNLTGSIKDRPAVEIFEAAYKNKTLKAKQVICETTSGNMGISLAAVGCYLGHKVIICIPEFMSSERINLLKMYGACVELTKDFKHAFELAQVYKSQGAFLPMQFENIANKQSHQKTTAQELLSQLQEISCFVAGVGTSGTLSGVGSVLKSKLNSKIFALEPEESGILTYKKSKGKHKIQGLSDDLVPKLYDAALIDGVISVKSDDAIAMAQKLCRQLGLGVGISSGANFLGCVKSGIDGATTVFSDDNKKYLSTDLLNEMSTELVDSINLVGYKVIVN